MRVREKSVKSQGILIWIMSGNPVFAAVEFISLTLESFGNL